MGFGSFYNLSFLIPMGSWGGWVVVTYYA